MTDVPPNSPIEQANKNSRSRRARARRGGLPKLRAPKPPDDLETKEEHDEWVRSHLSDDQSFEKFERIGEVAYDVDSPEVLQRRSIIIMNAFVADDEPVDVESLCRKLGIDGDSLGGEK